MTPKKFISEIKKNSSVDILNIYSSKDDYWDYYYHITGLLNGNYFAIFFTKKDKIKAIEIAETTDNVEEFTKEFMLTESVMQKQNQN